MIQMYHLKASNQVLTTFCQTTSKSKSLVILLLGPTVRARPATSSMHTLAQGLRASSSLSHSQVQIVSLQNYVELFTVWLVVCLHELQGFVEKGANL